jgi:general stress protein 26
MAIDKIELENRVRRVVLESAFAVLSTVGPDGKPYARWMSPIFARGDPRELSTLAAPASRKVQHIRQNPAVSWLFSSAAFEEVVTLHGRATVEDSPHLRAEIWEAMANKTRAFILKSDDNLQFLIIQTRVQRVEYLLPRAGETKPQVLEF